jgi:putative ABC transport system substrate-binding protein
VQELRRLGYVEGKNLVIEYRSANGDPDRMPEAAAELVKLNVDVILAVANAGAFAAKSATRTIPIVVWVIHGALATGLVSSLSRPGGNLTGTESLAPEIDAKRVELLKQIVPGLSRLAVVFDASDQGSPVHLKSTQAAGRALGVAISTLEVSYGPNMIEYSQRTAAQIDKILKGASPSELPVEQLTRFDLVINSKPAKVLGITIPQAQRTSVPPSELVIRG